MFSRSLAILQRANNGARQKLLAVTPSMQVYNLQADPANGSLTRFTAASRGIRLAVLPQIGQPHTDPEDDTPQFDFSRRATSTLSPKESAAFLSVLEGKVDTHSIQSEHRHITLAQKGPKSFKLSGSLTRTDNEVVPLDLTLEKATLTTFRCFLESAIDEGFGFHQHFNPPQKLVEKRYDQKLRLERREFDRQNDNRNSNRNSNNNNSNNRNSNSNNSSSNNNNNGDRNRNRNRSNNNNNGNNNGNNSKKQNNQSSNNQSKAGEAQASAQ